MLKKRAGSGFGCPCLLQPQNTPTTGRSRELRRTWTPGAWSEPVAPLWRWAACSVGMGWEPEGRRAGPSGPQSYASLQLRDALLQSSSITETEASPKNLAGGPEEIISDPESLLEFQTMSTRRQRPETAVQTLHLGRLFPLHSQRSLPLQPQLLQEPVNPVLKGQCS